MTNYEKIKTMSVEEMAEMFSKATQTLAVKIFDDWVANEPRDIKKYLESEAEE